MFVCFVCDMCTSFFVICVRVVCVFRFLGVFPRKRTNNAQKMQNIAKGLAI